MSTAVNNVITAVHDVLSELFPQPVLVSFGDPGSYQPDVIVGVTDVRTNVERPVMATTRPREEVIEVDVVFSVYVAGGPEAQPTANAQAYSMLATFADYFRTRPNETLGGACREAWVSSYNLAQTPSRNPETGAPDGRVAEITAVVTARARV